MADQTAKYKYKKALVLTLAEGKEFEELLQRENLQNVSQYIKKVLREKREGRN